MTAERIPDHPIDPIFSNRWSPRAFNSEPIPEADLLTMLEAARWAPSAYNIQPWRFLYSHRGDPHWENYLSLLDPFNVDWAYRSSALIFLVSDGLMPAQGGGTSTRSGYNSFDSGATWAHIALQATSLGYHTHAMAGLRFDDIHAKLAIPESFKVEIAIAVGKRAALSALPEQLQARETPNPRLPLSRIAFNGVFPQ